MTINNEHNKQPDYDTASNVNTCATEISEIHVKHDKNT